MTTSTPFAPHFDKVEGLLGTKPSLLILRHAARPSFPEGSTFEQVLAIELSEQGEKDADELGRRLNASHPDLELKLALTSGMARNNATAARVIRAAALWEGDLDSIKAKIETEPMIVGQGLVAPDVKQAIGQDHSTTLKLYDGSMALHPHHSLEEAGEKLCGMLKTRLDGAVSGPKELGIVVGHDVMLGFIVKRYITKDVVPRMESGEGGEGRNWPAFLEAMLLQREADGSHTFHFRGHSAKV